MLCLLASVLLIDYHELVICASISLESCIKAYRGVWVMKLLFGVRIAQFMLFLTIHQDRVLMKLIDALALL